jgi:arabinofuranosyltransferase
MSFSDLAVRYAISLRDYLPVLLVAVAVLGRLSLRPARLHNKTTRACFGLALAVAAIGWAAALSWVGDDAFISFRYARNLTDGNGLVFNVGERVEGYTNFLWTVLLAATFKLGLDPAQCSVVLSIGCFLGVIGITWRYLAPRDQAADTIAIAPLVLAASYVFASYATSGLETMFGTLLVLGAFLAARADRPLLAGTLGIAATMAHPDHAIFYAGLGLTLLIQRRRAAPLVRYALPFVFVFVPYYAWRTHYYGDFYPNTFHAKSGDLWYVDQGIRYLLINVVSAGLTLCLPLALIQAIRERRTWLGTYFLIVLPIYFSYLVKIGGDFMLGRLLVPVLPFVFVLAESALSAARESGGRWRLAFPVIALALATVPNGVVSGGEIYEHIADERTFYRLGSFAPIRVNNGLFREAEMLRDVFANATRSPRLAIGNVGIVGYYTDFPMIDDFGLTDPAVARMELAKRGRVGHEKLSSPGNIVAQGADLAVLRVYPSPFHSLTTAQIGDNRFALAKYDRPFIDSWKEHPEVSVVDFVAYLDRFRVSSSRTRRDCQLWFLEQYYFSHNQDPQRLDRLRGLFIEKEPSWQSLDDFLLAGDPPPSRWLAAPIEDFDTHRLEWASTGTAFSTADTKRPGQRFIHGQTEAFATSYARAERDAAVGERVSAPFTVTGDVMTLRVGGGPSSKTRVELIHDGRVVHRSVGCRSEIMGRRVWNVTPLRGQEVQIRLVDASTESWGHVLVDTIAQWQRAK